MIHSILSITWNVKVVFRHRCVFALQWRHKRRDSVSNHQPHDCFLKRLFRRRSKKTSKLRVTGLCEGNSPETGEFPAQRASNAENVSIWWRHHGIFVTYHIWVSNQQDHSLVNLKQNFNDKDYELYLLERRNYKTSIFKFNETSVTWGPAIPLPVVQGHLTHWGWDKMAVISQTIFQTHFLEWKCRNFD